MSGRKKIFDAAVVGGGLAGACAAFHLTQAGHSTLLLEKEPSAHHKVCGEFFMPGALPYLREMGLELPKLGAAIIRKVRIHARYFSFSRDFPEPAYGLSRYRLDELCLQAVAEIGAKVKRGIAVQRIAWENGVAHLIGSGEKFSARRIFAATGKHEASFLPKRRGREAQAIGFKMHLERPALAEHCLSLFLFPGGYAGLSPIEEGRWNLCLIVDKKIFQSWGGNFEGLVAGIAKHSPEFQKILPTLRWLWEKPLCVANIPYGYQARDRNPNLRKVGDQSCVIPSLTGSGMAIALMTAKAGVRESQGEDRSESDAMLRRAMRWAYPLHRALQYPGLGDLGLALFKIRPGWFDVAWKEMQVPWVV